MDHPKNSRRPWFHQLSPKPRGSYGNGSGGCPVRRGLAFERLDERLLLIGSWNFGINGTVAGTYNFGQTVQVKDLTFSAAAAAELSDTVHAVEVPAVSVTIRLYDPAGSHYDVANWNVPELTAAANGQGLYLVFYRAPDVIEFRAPSAVEIVGGDWNGLKPFRAELRMSAVSEPEIENAGTIRIRGTAPPVKPDLVGTKLALEDANGDPLPQDAGKLLPMLHAGEEFFVEGRVKYQRIDFYPGATGVSYAPSGSFDVAVYLSRDSTIDTSDYLLDTMNLSSLDGLFGRDEATFRFNTELPPPRDEFWKNDGPVYVGMVIDPAGKLDELDRTNNSNRGPGIDRVDLLAIDTDVFPDLRGTTLRVTRNDGQVFQPGEFVDFTYNIENGTFADAGAYGAHFLLSHDTRFELPSENPQSTDMVLGDNLFTGGLEGGTELGKRSSTVQLPPAHFPFWQGGRVAYLGMILNADRRVEEGDYANNRGRGRFIDFDEATTVAPFVVNSSESRDDKLPGDEQCNTGQLVNGVPECTLWAAIQESNAMPERQRIHFDPAINSINVSKSLPEITDPVAVLGGASRVVLLGNAAGSGLTISAGDSTISGLTVAGFDGIGVELRTKGKNIIENCEIIGSDAEGIVIGDGSNENTIRNNLIGTDTNGSDRGNELAGIRIRSNSNLIGGDSPTDGNVIAYNSKGIVVELGFNRIENNVIVANRDEGVYLIDGNNTVRSNYIGGDRDGTARGNGKAGIFSESEHNTIGGTTSSTGNVIANNLRGIDLTLADENTIENNEILANTQQGIVLRDGSDKNIVRRNYIGIDRIGFKFSNGSVGIWIASSNNIIGGSGDGEGNTIAYNGVQDDAAGSNSSSGNGVVVAAIPDISQANSSISGNAILGNAIYLNAGPGIDLGHNGLTANDHGTPEIAPDLDDGPNQLQNFPVLLMSFDGKERFGKIRSTPNQKFRIEIFATSASEVMLRNEGRTYLTSLDVTTDAQGLASFKVPAINLESDKLITATATRANGDGTWGSTSEFSNYPARNIDDCTNTELQKKKDGIWKSILVRIDAVTADDYAAWQRLRQLALNSVRPESDGCILVTEATLLKLDELVTTQTVVQEELGWWEDFWDIMADDYDRVDGLLQTAWDSAWDAAVVQYDAAPTFDDIWADISSLSDPEFRNNLLLSLRDSASETIEQIQTSLENGVVFLGRHGNDLLWDAVVSAVEKSTKAETYSNLVADLLAFETLSKAFDPNVPVEQRVGNWLFGYVQVIGVLEGGAFVAKGVNAARARAFTKKLATEFTDDPNAQRALVDRMVRQMDDSLERSTGIFGQQKPGIFRLKDGDIIDDELLWTTGYTKEQADAIRAIAKGRYTLRFRPTNMDSARWIRQGSLPKPVTIKAKTISEIDIYLGYRVDDLGLVGLKDPKKLLDPDTLDACKNPNSRFCAQLKERFQKHETEYAKLKKDLGDVYDIDDNGVVYEKASRRTVAGDIDPIEFFRADGTRVTGEEYDRLLTELREASIQHGGEVYFAQDMINAMALTCKQNPPKCKAPGSEEWLEELSKARNFTAGQRVKYAAGEEVGVEFGIDDVIRKRDIDELPDILTGGEAEDAPPPPNYNLEEFKFLLEQSKIDIRRDRLTTLNSLIAAIQERSDSQATLVAKLLQRAEPNGSITTVAFESMSAVELVGLIEAEPKGLHIDPVVSSTTAEGEDAAALTANGILAKIHAAVGDSGMANYQVDLKDNGGFLVHSLTARERPYDANGDGRASPIDALVIINRLNSDEARELVLWPSLPDLRIDINFDGFLSPIDVLIIINFLNSRSDNQTFAEGESSVLGEGESTDTRPSASSPRFFPLPIHVGLARNFARMPIVAHPDQWSAASEVPGIPLENSLTDETGNTRCDYPWNECVAQSFDDEDFWRNVWIDQDPVAG